MENNVFMKLYVAGDTLRSKKAIDGVTTIFDERLKGQGTLEIIDVLKDPQSAEEANVMATPTLILLTPPPMRRLIGDLSDGKRVFDLLNLRGKNS